MEALTPFIFPALLVVAFYLLIIRPARNRTQTAARLQDSLAPGLEVMTTSGIFATVASIEDDAVELEVSPGVRMRFSKAAVARIIPADETSDDLDDAVDGAADEPLSESGTDDRPQGDQTSR